MRLLEKKKRHSLYLNSCMLGRGEKKNRAIKVQARLDK